jgi:hypothetical protein
MNIFCRALGDVGAKTTVRFLQDRYTLGEYLKIMLTTARHYPGVFALTARVLGPAGLLKWATDLAAFTLDEAARSLLNVVGSQRWRRLEHIALGVSPAAALALIAKRTRWRLVSGRE